MKTTSLEKISIPSEAKQEISFHKDTNNISDHNEMGTGMASKWITLNWLGVATTVGLNLNPFIADQLFMIPLITGILTAMSTGVLTMALSLMTWETVTDLHLHMKDLKKDISATEWKSSIAEGDRGFRIHSKSRGNAVIELLMPRRIFRRILMNETVWYSPLRDVYTLQKSYLTRSAWVEETREIAGRRYVFQQALKSL